MPLVYTLTARFAPLSAGLCRFMPLIAAALLAIVAPPAQAVSAGETASTLPQGRILLKRETQALPPTPPEDMKALLRRLAAEEARAAAAASEQRILALTSEQLSDYKEKTRQEAAQLAQQKVQEMQADLNARSQKTQAEIAALTAQKTAELEATLKAYAEQKAREEAQNARLSEEDVRTISQSTLTDAQAQMRALALQAVAESDDYIRTLARETVQDSSDPAVQTALQTAARKALIENEDEQVVFAIRKVVEETLEQKQLAAASPAAGAAGPAQPAAIVLPAENRPVQAAGFNAEAQPAAPASRIAVAPTHFTRRDWLDLRDYRVVVHEDGRRFQDLMEDIIRKAEPYTGPWQIRWKINPENADVLNERFSLDAETRFETFINYLAQYMVNDRGLQLTFSLFDSERVMVISD